jgi:hypothetical protein
MGGEKDDEKDAETTDEKDEKDWPDDWPTYADGTPIDVTEI